MHDMSPKDMTPKDMSPKYMSPSTGDNTNYAASGTPDLANGAPTETIERADNLHLLAPSGARALLALVAPVLESMGFALVRVRLQQGVLQVMAENADGTLGIDDCEAISAALSAVLDVEDPIIGGYRLEVSSAGLTRPLTRPQDFERYRGHQARFLLNEAVSEQRQFRGMICGFENGEALLEIDGEKIGALYKSLDSKGPQVLGFALSQISDARLMLDEEDLRLRMRGAKHELDK